MKLLRILIGLALLGAAVGAALAQGTGVYTNNPAIVYGMKWKGAYSGGTTYALNDVVTSGGSSYISLAAGNVGHAVSNGTYWTPVGAASGGVTASAMQSALAGQTGCTTTGYAWNPATNTCTATSGASLPLPISEYRTSTTPPMANWLAAFHNCNRQVVNLVGVTDSYGMAAQYNGAGPGDPNNRLLSQMRIYLQSVCPSHGTGLHPFVQQLNNGTPNPNPDSRFYSSVSPGTVTIDSVVGPSMPFGGSTIGAVGSFTSGSTFVFDSITDVIPFDTINTYCETGPSYGTWSIYNNDSTPGATSSTGTLLGTCGGNSSSATAVLSTIAIGSSATHTIQFVCSATPCMFYGADGTNGTVGVSVHPLAMASTVAEYYNPSSAFAFMDLIPNGIHGLITLFGTNEPLLSYSTSSYTTALTRIVTHEAATSTKPSILFLTAPVTTATNSATDQPVYGAAVVSLAASLGVSVVNVLDQWGSTYNAQYFISPSDTVHPSDPGTLAYFGMVRAAMIDSDPSVATGTGAPGAGGGEGDTITPTTINAPGSATLAVQTNGNLTTFGGPIQPLFIKPSTSGVPSGSCTPNGSWSNNGTGNGHEMLCYNGSWVDVTALILAAGSFPQVTSLISGTNGDHSAGISVGGGTGCAPANFLSIAQVQQADTWNVYYDQPSGVWKAQSPCGGSHGWGAFRMGQHGGGGAFFQVQLSSTDLAANATATDMDGPAVTIDCITQQCTFTKLIASVYQGTLTTPSSSSATCIAGQFADDANYHYVCTATNTWKRAALSTF